MIAYRSRRLVVMLAAVAASGCGGRIDRNDPINTAPWELSEVEVYILSGQSNCVGVASPVENLTIAERSADSGYHVWETLGDPIESSTNAWVGGGPTRPMFGPELFFGKTMSGAGRNAALIKYAVSGAGLEARFLPQRNDLYPKLVAEVHRALEQIPLPYRIAGLVWVGSEADGGALESAQRWSQNFASFTSAFRGEFGSNVPVFFSRLGLFMVYDAPAALMACYLEQTQYANNCPNCWMTDVDDLSVVWNFPGSADGLHYDWASQRKLGTRLAESALFRPN